MKNFILYTAVAIAFSIVQSLIIAILAGRMYPQFFIKEKKSLRKFEIGEMFKDCGVLFVYKMDDIVLKATDNFVLSAFLGLVSVGMYSNYLIFYEAITSILAKFYDSCGASIGNLYVTEDVSKSYSFFRVMNFISVVLYGTACVGVAVMANEFILNWIGADYLIAQPLPILIGIEILFVGIKNNLGRSEMFPARSGICGSVPFSVS